MEVWFYSSHDHTAGNSSKEDAYCKDPIYNILICAGVAESGNAHAWKFLC